MDFATDFSTAMAKSNELMGGCHIPFPGADAVATWGQGSLHAEAGTSGQRDSGACGVQGVAKKNCEFQYIYIIIYTHIYIYTVYIYMYMGFILMDIEW